MATEEGPSFHLDENVAMSLAWLLRSYGCSVVTYEELGLRGAPDSAHLTRAFQHGRILITNNWKDFKLLHGAWRRWTALWGVEHPHPGMLALEQDAPPEQAALAVWEFVTQGGRPVINELYRWRRSTGWERCMDW